MLEEFSRNLFIYCL